VNTGFTYAAKRGIKAGYKYRRIVGALSEVIGYLRIAWGVSRLTRVPENKWKQEVCLSHLVGKS
jgi:hypothetical protein